MNCSKGLAVMLKPSSSPTIKASIHCSTSADSTHHGSCSTIKQIIQKILSKHSGPMNKPHVAPKVNCTAELGLSNISVEDFCIPVHQRYIGLQLSWRSLSGFCIRVKCWSHKMSLEGLSCSLQFFRKSLEKVGVNSSYDFWKLLSSLRSLLFLFKCFSGLCYFLPPINLGFVCSFSSYLRYKVRVGKLRSFLSLLCRCLLYSVSKTVFAVTSKFWYVVFPFLLIQRYCFAFSFIGWSQHVNACPHGLLFFPVSFLSEPQFCTTVIQKKVSDVISILLKFIWHLCFVSQYMILS